MKTIYKFSFIGFGSFAIYSFFISLIVYLGELSLTLFCSDCRYPSIVLTVFTSFPLILLSILSLPLGVFERIIGLQPFPPVHNNLLQVNIFDLLISNILYSILGGILGLILGLTIISLKKARNTQK